MAALNCGCRYGAFLSKTQRGRLFLSSVGLIIIQNRFYSEKILFRRRKKDRLTVLKVLASTVKHAPTAHRPHYQLIDDRLLNPNYKAEIFESIDSGSSCAESLMDKYPQLFPMRASVPAWPRSEKVLKNMKNVKKQSKAKVANLRLLMKGGENIVKVATLYEELDSEGDISFDLSNDVLEYLSFYAVYNESGSFRWKQAAGWNLADKLFNKLKMKNTNTKTRTFELYILGLLRCGETLKAFEIYREMKGKNIFGTLFMYNTLLSHLCEGTSSNEDRWNLALNIVDSMIQCNIRPNLVTFNSLMAVASGIAADSPVLCLQLVREMKSLNISPSLGSYYFLFRSERKQTTLYKILEELKSGAIELKLKHHSDGLFFNQAMSFAKFQSKTDVATHLLDIVINNKFTFLLGSEMDFYTDYIRTIAKVATDVNSVLKEYHKLVPNMFLPNNAYLYKDLFNLMRDKKDITHLPVLYKYLDELNVAKHDALFAMFSAMEENNIPNERCEEYLVVAQRADSFIGIKTKKTMSVIIKLLCLCGKYSEVKETMEKCEKLNITPNVDTVHSVFKLAIENGDKDYALDLKRHNVGLTDVTDVSGDKSFL